MEYRFSFSRSRMLLIGAAFVVAGLLIFFCGVVAGIGLTVPLARKTAETAQSGLKLPKAPDLKAPQIKSPEVKSSEVKAPELKLPEVKAPELKAAGAAPAPVETKPAAAPPAETKASPASVPGPSEAAAVAAIPDPATEPYTLQFGAFREQKPAKQLQADLKQKGYNTVIYNLLDEDQRTWHVVRFGGYKDLSTASKAASDLTEKEGVQALVKRSDSL